jgi:hypothetical protein
LFFDSVIIKAYFIQSHFDRMGMLAKANLSMETEVRIAETNPQAAVRCRLITTPLGMRVKLKRIYRKRCKRGAAEPRVEAAKQAGTLGVDADRIKPCKGGAGFCIALTGLASGIINPRVPKPALACFFTLGSAAPRLQRLRISPGLMRMSEGVVVKQLSCWRTPNTRFTKSGNHGEIGKRKFNVPNIYSNHAPDS